MMPHGASPLWPPSLEQGGCSSRWSRTPVVVIHITNQGNQLYLRKCLQETKRHNHDNVILLGDNGNKQMCKEIGIKHIHIDSFPLSEERKQFDKHFVNHSSNSYEFEKSCFLRWFIMFEFMTTHKIDRVVTTDSDVALLCESNVWEDIVLGNFITKENVDKPFRMSNCIHTGVVTLDYISKFVVLCHDIYVSGTKQYLIDDKIEFHKSNTGGVCDMTVTYLLNLTENVSNLADPSVTDNGGIIMNHIVSSEGYLGLEQYEMKNGLLCIYVVNNKYYLYDTIREILQLLLIIHFQGSSKNLLNGGYDISTLPNITRIGR